MVKVVGSQVPIYHFGLMGPSINLGVPGPDNEEVEPAQLVQINTYQIPIEKSQPDYISMMSLGFRKCESPPTLHTRFCSLCNISKWQLRAKPRHDKSISCKVPWQIYRDKEQPLEKEISQNESWLQFPWRQFQQQKKN